MRAKWDTTPWWQQNAFRTQATAALAAAAPLIAQQTLEDLAQEMHDWAALHVGPDGAHFARLWETRLTARAATLTPKEN